MYGQDELIVKENCIEVPAIYFITQGAVEVFVEAGSGNNRYT